MRRTAESACADPADVDWQSAGDDLGVLPVRVPCTVASALRDVGRLDLEDAASLERVGDLDRADWWFRCRFAASPDEQADAGSPTALLLGGLATRARVWLNGRLVLESGDMFLRHRVEIGDLLAAHNELVLCFRGLGPFLAEKRPRARWRTALVPERQLRFLRTTLFGRIPAFTPPVPAVGPWREIALLQTGEAAFELEDLSLHADLEDGQGVVTIDATLRGDASGEMGRGLEGGSGCWRLEVGSVSATLDCQASADGVLRVQGRVVVPDPERWAPHTMLPEGETPRRHPVALVLGEGPESPRLDLEPVGFRQIEREAGERFALRINGERLFCRGTCWTPIDPLALDASPERLRASLEQVRDAGFNMLRVTGTLVYEQDEFYRFCDELGLLVWQDFMFATFDYPTGDPAFRRTIEAEVDDFLGRVRHRACLAVLCGSSEGQQQPAMLGLEAEDRADGFFDEWLPGRCAESRPDVPFWPSTPSGGELPFHTRSGTSHYFGVGAYRRGFEDLFVARPAFATECLAFAGPPGLHGPDPTPRSRVPRDRGADWDFADVTTHYRRMLLGEDADAGHDAGLRAQLDRVALSRVMETVAARLRDPEADCGGALVLMHRDPWACAGWGVLDADGRPKSGWYGLARGWAPIGIAILDDGLEGLGVRIWNDRGSRLEDALELRLMRFDGAVIAEATHPLRLPARGFWRAGVDRLVGGFLDSSHAYRFGPRSFDFAVARLRGRAEAGACGSEAIHLPSELGRLPRSEVGLGAAWRRGPGGALAIEVRAMHLAQAVVIEVDGGIAADGFFHLAPDRPRRVAVGGAADRVEGARVRALNTDETVELGAPPRAAGPSSEVGSS